MLDRSVAPAAEKISKPNLPSPEIIPISEGMELVVLTQHDQPAIMLDLAFPVSRSTENNSTIYLAAKMLMEGTREKSSAEIASFLDFHGSHLEIRPSLDHVHIRLYCLKKYFNSQLNLIVELLNESIYPERQFEKAKNIRTQQIKQQHAKTNAFASLKFREKVFGAQHPYGRISSVEEVVSTTHEEVLKFYQNGLLTQPSIFLAGDVSQNEIELLNGALKPLQFYNTANTSSNKTISSSGEHIIWENAVQCSLRMGGQIIDKNHPDIHLLHITNELLGGFFGSRLMKNIREEKGLTYGIHSSIVHLKDGSYWTIGTDVLKEKADLAVNEIKKEIQTLATTSPSEEELATLKSYLQGKWLMSFDNCFNSMQHIVQNNLAGLDQQYWIGFLNQLESCTAKDIRQTAAKYFNKDLIEVIVG
ncbi:pitrilysin family protein [Marinoscillum sp. MHG1-6]|uniref:M16 family metallopeptidase n=1 Tax=Marinoscillum sp. MHG1-6 TaxID=2959627 RepID=UPI00215887CE|nr:pitrilysin family protein [Marinoscillum sp. MHG1-6]